MTTNPLRKPFHRFIEYIDYGDSKDLIFNFTKYRSFSVRWYSEDVVGSWFSRYNYGIRQLSLGSGHKWKRFALDFNRLSFVFQNYKY